MVNQGGILSYSIITSVEYLKLLEKQFKKKSKSAKKKSKAENSGHGYPEDVLEEFDSGNPPLLSCRSFTNNDIIDGEISDVSTHQSLRENSYDYLAKLSREEFVFEVAVQEEFELEQVRLKGNSSDGEISEGEMSEGDKSEEIGLENNVLESSSMSDCSTRSSIDQSAGSNLHIRRRPLRIPEVSAMPSVDRCYS
jgi:hypothetical protein